LWNHPEHVPLVCTANEDLCALRGDFYHAPLAGLDITCPHADDLLHDEQEALVVLKRVIFNRKSIIPVAGFTDKVFKLVEQFPFIRHPIP
jgi:hypothetical protein